MDYAQSDYLKYRGKCEEEAKKLASIDQSLLVIKGWYICPIWGKQAHWWCKDSAGRIIDPTAKQFPSNGIGEYVEYDGTIECEFCHAITTEGDCCIDGHHVYCSYECYGKDVMGDCSALRPNQRRKA